MVTTQLRAIAIGLAAFGGIVAGLTGCTVVDAPGGAPTEDAATHDATADGGGESGMVVVSGTGSYVIGVDIPYGGFELKGEPDAQPAGCTWAILDADGVATFENLGQYAFITDIPEGVTFETSGCPDWVQFE